MWTLIVYTPGFVILKVVAFYTLEAIFISLGSLPPDTNPIYLTIFFCLSILFYLSTLAPISQAVTRINSQAKSFQTNYAPFMTAKGVKNMQSTISWVKFYLPIEALLRTGIYGSILAALASFGIATLFSGYWTHAVIYAIATFIFYVLGESILGGADVLGAKANQIEKDAQANYRNYALAKDKEQQINLQRRALEQSQEEHQRRLEEKRLRDQAHKRDLARRRKDSFNSTLRKIYNYFFN